MLAKQGLSVYCLQKGTVTIAENIACHRVVPYNGENTLSNLGIYFGLKAIKLEHSLACYAESLL